MADAKKPMIVVKRITKGGGAAHGGAWKIAYADFVTAMMAFFLLMWLLGSTTNGDLQGIADYFRTPLKVALAGGSGSGDSSSVIKGGGKDLTRSDGQVQKTNQPQDRRTINLQAAKAELERLENGRLVELKARIDGVIEANAALRTYRRQIVVEITLEGLRVQIIDEQNRPMFDSGSAELKPYTREILRELGRMMNDVPNRISLSGHTDGNPYADGDRGYSNWELSADRANAARRVMIDQGLHTGQLRAVRGFADTELRIKDDPLDPRNRRVSIVVRSTVAAALESAVREGQRTQ